MPLGRGMVRASEAGDRLAVLRSAARGLHGKLRALGEERGARGLGRVGTVGGAGAGALAFPEGSPEAPLRSLGAFPGALWEHVQAAPESEYTRTKRWYGLGCDVAEFNRLAVPLLADVGAGVRRPLLRERPAFVHHVMGLVCDLAQVNICADLLGLVEEVQVHHAAARLWGKAAGGDGEPRFSPVEFSEALGRATHEPVQGLQKALAPVGDFFGQVTAEVYPAISLLHSLQDLQATGALDIDQEFRPPAGCYGWEFLASAQEYEQWCQWCLILFPSQSKHDFFGGLLTLVGDSGERLSVLHDVVLPLRATLESAIPGGPGARHEVRAILEKARPVRDAAGLAADRRAARSALIAALRQSRAWLKTDPETLHLEFYRLVTYLALAHREVLWYFNNSSSLAARAGGVATARASTSGGLENDSPGSVVTLLGEASTLMVHLTERDADVAKSMSQKILRRVNPVLPLVNRLASADVDPALLLLVRRTMDGCRASIRTEEDGEGGAAMEEDIEAAAARAASIRGLRLTSLRFFTVVSFEESKHIEQMSEQLRKLDGDCDLAEAMNRIWKFADLVGGLAEFLEDVCPLRWMYYQVPKLQVLLLGVLDGQSGHAGAMQHLACFVYIFKAFERNNSEIYSDPNFARRAGELSEGLLSGVQDRIGALLRELAATDLRTLEGPLVPCAGSGQKSSGWNALKGMMRNRRVLGAFGKAVPMGEMGSTLVRPGAESLPAGRAQIQGLAQKLSQLCGLCRGLCDMERISVSRAKIFHPRGFLHRGLQDAVARCLNEAARGESGSRGGGPDGTAVLERPSTLEAAAHRILLLLSGLQEYCQVDMPALACDSFDGVGPDGGAEQGRLREVYSAFYIDTLVKDSHEVGVFFSPNFSSFMSTSSPPSLQAAFYGDTSELRSLVRVFGASFVEQLRASLVAEAGKLLGRLHDCLGANKIALTQLGQAVRLPGGGDAAEGTGGAAAALANLVDVERGLEAVVALGRCQRLGALLDDAASTSDSRYSLSEAGLLGAAEGSLGGEGLVACALSAHSSDSSDAWGAFHLLAAGFLTSDTWAGLKYDSGSGALELDLLSMGVALQAICSALPHSSPTVVREAVHEFLVGAAEAVWGLEGGLQDSKLILLDNLVHEGFIDRGSLEAFFPVARILLAYEAVSAA